MTINVSNDIAGSPVESAQRRAPHDGKLRIAIFSGNYNYLMDGPVRALNKLVAHLECRGHDVLVFAPTDKNRYLDHSGTLISLPSITAPRRPEFRIALGVGGDAKRALETFNPDIVHVTAPELSGLGALKYARKNDIPAVASFHTRFDTYLPYYGASMLQGALNRYLRNFYDRCEHVYPPSQSTADELLRYGFGKDIRLWARGVDSQHFAPDKRDLAWRRSIGFSDDDCVVLFVGRLVREKGLDLFAKSANLARRSCPELRVLIVGDGPERARFRKWMPDALFLGHQTGADLARAYSSGDIFFNPSVTETFGQVTLESMASGIPAICANATGSVSLVENGTTGFVSDPDASLFAGYLQKLASSPSLRRNMGAAARQRSLAYSWEAILDGLIANYFEAISGFYRDRPDRISGSAAA